MSNPAWISRLQNKWGLANATQVILVLLTFTLTGSTVVYLKKALFVWLGFNNSTSIWLKTVVYLLFVFPAYQVLILVFGSMLGQYKFFWAKEKKLLQFLRILKKD
jgi:hypothetical protein